MKVAEIETRIGEELFIDTIMGDTGFIVGIDRTPRRTANGYGRTKAPRVEVAWTNYQGEKTGRTGFAQPNQVTNITAAEVRANREESKRNRAEYEARAKRDRAESESFVELLVVDGILESTHVEHSGGIRLSAEQFHALAEAALKGGRS